MIGLIATKEGMTRLFQEDGKSLPVSVLKVATNFVSQIKQKRPMATIQFNFPLKIKKKKTKQNQK